MQTMPNRTRMAVMVSSILLAVVVGAAALWSANKEKQTAPVLPDEMISAPDQYTSPVTTTPGGATTGTPRAGNSTGTPVLGTTSIPATHTVAAGESLYDISRRYYGDHIYAGDIEALNQLPDPNHLHERQELKLPKLEDLKR